MPLRLRLALLTVTGLGLLAASACSSAPGGRNGGTDSTITVFAAASLTDAMRDIASAFEELNPGVEVALSFDGSSTLAAQLSEGAPGDVFAAADEETMRQVAESAGIRAAPVVFARNELQIVVAEGNPHRVETLEHLDGRGLVVALCRREVPCGGYAARAFERAGLVWPDAAEEANVTAVLTKVRLGEADAGVVYRSDVRRAEGVEGIDLPAAVQVAATYPAAVLSDADDPAVASEFVAFLLTDEAQAVLAAAGFASP